MIINVLLIKHYYVRIQYYMPEYPHMSYSINIIMYEFNIKCLNIVRLTHQTIRHTHIEFCIKCLNIVRPTHQTIRHIYSNANSVLNARISYVLLINNSSHSHVNFVLYARISYVLLINNSSYSHVNSVLNL